MDEETLDILEFLKEMVSIVSKRFERCENLISQLTSELSEIKNRMESLEKNVRLVRAGKLDKSLLKVLEGKEITSETFKRDMS